MFINNDIEEKIFELAGFKDIEEATQSDIKRALIEIERKLNFFATNNLMHREDRFNIMIVDDLELSIFQFNQLLKKMGTTPNVARNKEEAIAELKKKEFDYIIVDLYLPDLQDGLSLISEIIKYKKEKNQNYRLIAISSTDDEKIIQQIYSLGVDEFITKSDNWHNEVLKYVANHLPFSENANFSKFICEDDICVYTLRHLNTDKQKEDLLQDISTSIFSQKTNIIINMENLKSFDEKFTSMFAQIYKNCHEQNGKLVILSPSHELQNALQNAFLNDLIKTASTITQAIALIKK